MLPSFAERVAGGLTPYRVLDQAWMQLPAIYVTPMEDESEADRDMTGYQQLFTERLAVLVVFGNAEAVSAGDRRGQAAADLIDGVKWGLFKALLHWNPNSVSENPDYADFREAGVTNDIVPYGHAGSTPGFYYVGMRPLEFPEARLDRSVIQFTFALDRTITEHDVWKPGADPLEGIDLYIVSDDGETVITSQQNDLWNANLREDGGYALREDGNYEAAEDTV